MPIAPGTRLGPYQITPAGEPQQMFELPYEMGNWDLAPDGTFIMMLATEDENAPPLRVVTDWQRLLRD